MSNPANPEDMTRLLPGDGPQPRRFPERIGQYQVIRSLGEGGMGVVLLARDAELQREVAIKLVRGELVSDKAFIDRFFREARLSASLNHPNVVTTYQTGRHNDLPYLVLEYVPGRTLRDALREPPPLPTTRILEIMIQCCNGLEAAARRGIVHRDVKPANIMIREDGLVKVMDFGLSKNVEGDTLTLTSAVMGTPDYMSPEQAAGKATDFRTDLYALGITFFQCLTGYLPYKSSSVFETIRQHAEAPLPEDERLKHLAGGRLLELIRWMTAKAPDGRPNSYARVREELESIREVLRAEEGIETKPLESRIDPKKLAEAFLPKPATGPRTPTPSRLPKPTARPRTSGRPGKAILVALLLLCLGGGGFAGWRFLLRSSTSAGATVSDPPEPAQSAPAGTIEATSTRRVGDGPVTYATSRGNTATARDILHQLGNLGMNQILSPDLQPERFPVSASFEKRTPGHILRCLTLAAGWQTTEEDGVVRVSPGNRTPWPELARLREELDRKALPSFSINTIDQSTTVRMACDRILSVHGIDYLIVSHDIANARLPSVSLSQIGIPAFLDQIDRTVVPIEWAIVDQTIIIVPEPPKK